MMYTNLEDTLGRDIPAIALELGTGLRAAAGTFLFVCHVTCLLTGSSAVDNQYCRTSSDVALNMSAEQQRSFLKCKTSSHAQVLRSTCHINACHKNIFAACVSVEVTFNLHCFLRAAL